MSYEGKSLVKMNVIEVKSSMNIAFGLPEQEIIFWAGGSFWGRGIFWGEGNYFGGSGG